MNKFFTIAIPTYEMHEMGPDFLEHSFKILEKQTFTDFDVVVSDHSKNRDIFDVCDKWKNTLSIKYFLNEENRGNSSSNLNNAISKSEGRYIKILFQDDFLFGENSMRILRDEIQKNPNDSWFISASEHSQDGVTFYNTHQPCWNDQMIFGKNTLSSPSVLTIKNEDILLFDPNYIWLMDCDYYQRCYFKFGNPKIINDVTVVNRTWQKQLTNTISSDRKNWEHVSILQKFGVIK